MNAYYLMLDIIAVLGPIALSFDKRVTYYRQWKAVFIASLIVAVPFLVHDYIFTYNDFWGFNPKYLLGFNLGELPIEEVAFFFVVPFSCYFIYACLNYYARSVNPIYIDRFVQMAVFIYLITLIMVNSSGWYTLTVVPFSLIILGIWIFSETKGHIGLAFLLSLIPFLLMNGALTGLFTKEPVVWYSELEKIPGRILTIPYEDVLYAFSLIISVILLSDRIQNKQRENRPSFRHSRIS